jgi:hypothetical protein
MYLAREAFQNKSSDIGLVSQMVPYKLRFEISLAILSKHKCRVNSTFYPLVMHLWHILPHLVERLAKYNI